MKRYFAAFLLALACAVPARATPIVVPSTAAPASYDVAPVAFSFVASSATAGNSFTHTGRELLVVFNSDSNPHAITVTSVPDASGRTGDSTATVAAGAYYVFQFFPPSGWRQTDGTIHITSADPTLKLAVIKFP